MVNRSLDWLSERIPFDWNALRHFTSEPIPRHMSKWWFCLGGTPLYLFLIQIASGIALTFYYVPEPKEAYESVRHITQVVPFGWWVRGIHRWSGELMVVSVILHMMRVFFTGAYRRPRELNWVLGMGLLVTVFTFGFTGYSLIYNQLSFWATVVGTNIAAAVPFVGEYIAGFMRGGPVISANTLTRFYVLHIGVLPTVMIGLLALHIFLIRIHGVSEFIDTSRGESRDDSGRFFPFFPDHFLTEVAIGVFLIFFVSQLAIIFPAQLGDPANPAVTPETIKPEWYFYPVFRWLKLFSFQIGIVSTIIIVLVMFAWPWIDHDLERRFPGREISLFIGAAAVIVMTVLVIIEGLAGH
jgi:ubiquinol-cytochrome c reductase cytochrome b subunit/cytochrome b6